VVFALAQFVTLQEYRAGTILMRSGEQTKSFCVLLEGTLARFIANSETSMTLRKHKFVSDLALK
jgi:hypothetical protein